MFPTENAELTIVDSFYQRQNRRPLVDLAQLPIELKEREEVGKKDLCLLGKMNSKMRDRE